MRHSHRSPLTGRFVAKRSTSAELVEEHNRGTLKRRLWGWMDAIGMTVLLGTVGFLTAWALAIVWGVCK